MYSEEQKREHIKEIQQLLYELSYYNATIPRIIPDGIYGVETAEAVRLFQREYGLEPTGIADDETFERLAEINLNYYKEIKMPDVFKRDSLVIPGSAGPVVYMIQLMLNTIGNGYINMPIIQLTGIYDAPTENSVAMFKRVSGNDFTNEGVDIDLWNDIVSKFNKLVL